MSESNERDTKTGPESDKDTESESTPVLVFLSGRLRGTHERITEQTVFLTFNAFGGISIVPASQAVENEAYPISLHRSGETYELKVGPTIKVWVNGKKKSRHTLSSGEILEIGRNGPMLRYRIYDSAKIPPRTATNAFVDCIDSARYGDGSLIRRTGRLMSEMISELVIRTTIWFRLLVVIMLIALIISAVYLSRKSHQLEERLAEESSLMRGISELLQRNERDAITGEELLKLRAQLEKRVGELEARSVASREIITRASKSVVFLQGSYNYFDEETELPLRYVGLDASGQPIGNELGPALTLDGNGPLVVFQFTGTAFIAGGGGLLVTNRHVALPWEISPVYKQFEAMGLAPKLNRFLGYLPGLEKPFNVELLIASDEFDAAVLTSEAIATDARQLAIATTPTHPGDEVIVIGYPTGIQAMLARTHTAFLDKIDGKNLDFWAIVEYLSTSGLLTPLATQGMVGQVTRDAIVYDAETTHGGSGGPVLNMRGEVIAINTAFMKEFGGSNIGQPMTGIMPILNQAREAKQSQ